LESLARLGTIYFRQKQALWVQKAESQAHQRLGQRPGKINSHIAILKVWGNHYSQKYPKIIHGSHSTIAQSKQQ
jgi:hypothetical protein